MTRGRFVLSAFALSGCTQIFNPCPQGSEPDRVQQRCVTLLDHDPANENEGDGGDDLDSGTDAAPVQDADMDGGPQDGGGRADSGPDSSVEAGPCNEHDIEAWRNFHVNDGAVATMTTCIEQECDAGTCYPKACIRSAIGLVACDTCIDGESACVLEFCNSACGLPGNDAECRACTCEAGCVARFDGCAQVTLDVCEDVHGRDAEANETQLQGPWVLRMKGFTGLLQLGPLGPEPPPWSALYSVTHMSKGFTHAVPFAAHGRHYLLQHKSQCGNDPCIARISPVLSDGTLGRPVYMDTWSRGWDEIEVFQMNGQPHLLRYRTGAVSSQGEGKGHLLIDRMVFADGLASMALESAANVPNTPINALTWSSFESFEMSGHTYLLRYGTVRAGEVELVMLDSQQGTLSLTPITKDLHWSRGWDEIEVFVHAGQPYVVISKSGIITTDGEPSASAKVLRIEEAEGSLQFVTVFEGTWESGITHVRPFQHQGNMFVLTYSAITWNLSLRSLGADPSHWAADLLQPAWTSRWGGTTPWDILEVVQGSESSLP